MLARMILSVLACISLVCQAHAWQVVSAQWRPDANPWAEEQVWEGTFWTEGWGHEEQFYPKHMKPAGSIHVVLRNDSARPDTVVLTHVDGSPIADIVTRPDRAGSVIWYRVESPKLGPPDTSAIRDDPKFERSDPAQVPPGGWAECSIRLRSVPKDAVVLRFQTGDAKSLDVSVPVAAKEVRIEAIAFSPRIDLVHVFVRSLDGSRMEKGKVRLDGREVTARWTEGPKPSDLALVEVDLKPAWEYGSHHLIEVGISDGPTLAQPVRAWDGYFCIGLYGVLDPESVKDAKAHGFNAYFTGVSPLLDEAGLNYVPAYNVGEGRVKTDKQSGALFYQNKDEPDAHDWTRGEDLPPMDRLGVNAQSEVFPALRYQRARDPRTPNLLLVDNTYKPLHWYVYGQIPDVYCTDPYVPLNGRQLDYVWRALDVARDASTPRPLVSVLWGCALDGKAKYGNNAPTPEEMRMMVFHALGCGVKGISYFIDMTQKSGEGQFTGLSDIPQLWEEVGRSNRDVAVLAPYLSIACPVPGSIGGRDVWARSLMCGSDKMVVIAVNTKHYIGFETKNEQSFHEPAKDAELRIPLPAQFRDPKVQEVKDGALIPTSGEMREGILHLKLATLDTARAFVISM